jgi:hypothetical protein
LRFFGRPVVHGKRVARPLHALRDARADSTQTQAGNRKSCGHGVLTFLGSSCHRGQPEARRSRLYPAQCNCGDHILACAGMSNFCQQTKASIFQQDPAPRNPAADAQLCENRQWVNRGRDFGRLKRCKETQEAVLHCRR